MSLVLMYLSGIRDFFFFCTSTLTNRRRKKVLFFCAFLLALSWPVVNISITRAGIRVDLLLH
jgi:hypothetical protein